MVEEWDQAYAKYHAIFIRQHHHLSEALIGHQQQVRKIACSGGDWHGYDKSYQQRVADGSVAWGQMNSGLLKDDRLFLASGTPFGVSPLHRTSKSNPAANAITNAINATGITHCPITRKIIHPSGAGRGPSWSRGGVSKWFNSRVYNTLSRV